MFGNNTWLVHDLSVATWMTRERVLLVTFSILTAALFSATYIGAIVPGSLLVALYGFEVLVAVLQAFIFTILTAVYIGGAMHPEH